MARGRPPKPRPDGANVTAACFLEIYDDAIDAKAVLDSARGKYQAVFKKAETLGINRAALSRAIQEAARDRDKREIDDRDFRRYMLWLDKPVGTQADFGFADAPAPNGHAPEPESEADKAATETHVKRVAYHQGFEAGKAGANISACPFGVGTEDAQLWTSAWHAAQTEMVHALAPSRGRGRRRRASAEPEMPAGDDARQ